MRLRSRILEPYRCCWNADRAVLRFSLSLARVSRIEPGAPFCGSCSPDPRVAMSLPASVRLAWPDRHDIPRAAAALLVFVRHDERADAARCGAAAGARFDARPARRGFDHDAFGV